MLIVQNWQTKIALDLGGGNVSNKVKSTTYNNVSKSKHILHFFLLTN